MSQGATGNFDSHRCALGSKSDFLYGSDIWGPEMPIDANVDISHCTKLIIQTNLPNNGMTYLFGGGMKSTFTWAMPYKSIPTLLIT